MTIAVWRYKLAPYGQAVVGKGAYVSSQVCSHRSHRAHLSNEQSIVYKATEERSERQVAIKKSRVSRTVKRPTLQHETRVLQFLKGQAAIPAVYGYGQLEHFEYMAMELLGPSIAERQKDGAGVMVNTVIRVMDQAVRRIRIQASYSTE
jgi:predicted Ser/Thr protein kinase